MSSSKPDDLRFPTTPATVVLDAAKVSWTPHVYEHDPRSSSYGLEAATALGKAGDRGNSCIALAEFEVGGRSASKGGCAKIPHGGDG